MEDTKAASPRKAPPSWWKVQGGRFLAASTITATTLVATGWISGLRQVMHGALLSFAVAALLPFMLLVGGLLLIMLVGLILALVALAGADGVPLDHGLCGAGEAVVKGGGWLIPRYYRFLGRQRHPVSWGVPAGVLFGGLLLWALIALIVVPGETRTVRLLTEAKEGIERTRGESGTFPRPDAQGRLLIDGISAPGGVGGGAVLEDGFGRPFKYQASGKWKLASWTLTSMGFDGKPSADDLCVSGSTTLVEWVEKAERVARLLRGVKLGSASLGDRLAGIRALQCPAR
jgi:hypothetical protein